MEVQAAAALDYLSRERRDAEATVTLVRAGVTVQAVETQMPRYKDGTTELGIGGPRSIVTVCSNQFQRTEQLVASEYDALFLP